MSGRLIGNYLLIGLLGSGATSHVYLAEHQALKRRLAVKILSPSLTSTPEKSAKLLNEAVALAKVDHPNVVRVYDFGMADSIAFMALEFVDGQSLDQAINLAGIIPSERLYEITRNLLEGLNAIHSAGLLHRDIKPSNVLITKDGVAKLVDFGLAREIPRADEPRTDQFAGTAEYAAPELAVGRPPDIRSDLYALGATLYKAATGRVPFSGATIAEKLNKQLYEPLVPPRVYNPQLQAPLEQLILKLMSKDREQRPGASSEAAKMLSPLSGRSPVTRRVARSKHAAISASSKPRSSVGIVVGVALAVIAGTLAFLLTRTHDKKPIAEAKPRSSASQPEGEPTSESEPRAAAPPKRSDEKIATPSVLLLRQGTYLSGIVTISGDRYTVVAGGESIRLEAKDVIQWFKTSQEMAADAVNAGKEAFQLYDRAQSASDPRNANAFLRQAVDKAQASCEGYETTRKYFSSHADNWLDDSISKGKELLKLVREAELTSRSKSNPTPPPSEPKPPTERAKPPAESEEKRIVQNMMKAVTNPLLVADSRIDPLSRRSIRDGLLSLAGPEQRPQILSALLFFFTRSEHDWGTRWDELTLASPTIQYKSMPGRVLRKGSLSVEFEFYQGGVVSITLGSSGTRFTPPGGEIQTANNYSLAENVKTKELEDLQDYFRNLLKTGVDFDRKSHLELVQQLRDAIVKLRKVDPATNVSGLYLFLLVHPSTELSAHVAGVTGHGYGEVP